MYWASKKRIHIQGSEKWQSSYIAHINCSNCCSVHHIARSIYKQEKGKVFQYIRTKIKMTVSPFLLNLETPNFQRIMIWLKVRMCSNNQAKICLNHFYKRSIDIDKSHNFVQKYKMHEFLSRHWWKMSYPAMFYFPKVQGLANK